MKLNFWGAIEAATGDAMHHIFLVVLENNPPYFCSPPPITGTLTCHQRPPWNNKRKQTVKLWNFFYSKLFLYASRRSCSEDAIHSQKLFA